jgi:hypothetical protein
MKAMKSAKPLKLNQVVAATREIRLQHVTIPVEAYGKVVEVLGDGAYKVKFILHTRPDANGRWGMMEFGLLVARDEVEVAK